MVHDYNLLSGTNHEGRKPLSPLSESRLATVTSQVSSQTLFIFSIIKRLFTHRSVSCLLSCFNNSIQTQSVKVFSKFI